MKSETEWVMPKPEAEQLNAFVQKCCDELGLSEEEWGLYADVIREAYTAGFIRGSMR